MRRFLLLSAMLAVLGSCAGDEPAIDFNLSTLTMTGLPTGVVCLEFAVYPVASSTEVVRFFENVEAGQVVLGSGRLPPPGTLFEIAVDGYSTACGASSNASYRGTSGTISISAGERRVIDITFYPVESQMTRVALSELRTQGASIAPRFLHTATLLRDGRVLISGGFAQLQTTTCPSERTGFTCYRANAVADGYIFHPASGVFYQVDGGMLAPRAGHTATVLRDGRVMIAGGAESALIGFRDTPQNGETPRDLDMFIEPSGVSDTYEFFNPTPSDPRTDPQRRGFPEQGMFTNAAGEGREGTVMPTLDAMFAPRFLHGAAHLEGSVLIAGGTDGGMSRPSDETYEVYIIDDDGPITRLSASLNGSFPEASLLTVGDQIWLAGRVTQNGPTTSPPFELWQRPDDGGVGSTIDITREMLIPQYAMYGYRRPLLTASTPSTTEPFILVMGWFGPKCDANMLSSSGIRCTPAQPRSTLLRESASVNQMPTEGAAAHRHAYGSAVTLPNNTALFLGGFTDGFNPSELVSAFATNSPSLTSLAFPNLIEARAFHTTTVIPNGEGAIVLTIGGVSGQFTALTLNESIEYILVP